MATPNRIALDEKAAVAHGDEVVSVQRSVERARVRIIGDNDTSGGWCGGQSVWSVSYLKRDGSSEGAAS